MKNSCFAFLLTLMAIHTGLKAQAPKTNFGEEFSAPRAHIFMNLLYSDNQHSLVGFYQNIRGPLDPSGTYPTNKLLFQRYDSKLNLKDTLSFSFKQDRLYYENSWLFQNNIVVLMTEWDKKKDLLVYHVYFFNKDGKHLKSFEAFRIESYNHKKSTIRLKGGISPDKSKMFLSAFGSFSDKKHDEYELNFLVVDQSLNKVCANKFSASEGLYESMYQRPVINNDGIFYMLAKFYDDRSEQKKDAKNNKANKLTLFSYDGVSGKKSEIRLDLGTDRIQSAILDAGKDGKIHCIGTYTSKWDGTQEGIFSFQYEGGESALTAKKTPFKKDQLEAMGRRNTAKAKQKNELGLESDFDALDYFKNEDGSSILILEENSAIRYKVTNNSSTGISYYTEYYSLDIIVVDITSQGEISKLTLIPKDQITVNQSYTSYVLQKKDNKLYFVYNDEPSKLKYDPEEAKPIIVRAGDLKLRPVITVLDENRKLTRTLLDSDFDASLMTLDCITNGSGRLAFISRKIKNLKTRFQIVVVDLL